MGINFDFPFILTMLVLISGVIALLDILFWAKQRKKDQKPSIFIEYSRSFFPVLLIVLVIRSFIIQPYRVPSGSLEPTILPGDFIAVNQFAYGIRLPVGNFKIIPVGEPRRGDIMLFHWPVNPSMIFIKRVIGLPGDHVVYQNKVLTVNGKVAAQRMLATHLDIEPDAPPIPVKELSEDLLGVVHNIQVRADGSGETANIDVVVPANCYFMMGDNRDNSDDSRMWGCVPEANIVGKAWVVWLSWDSEQNSVRWQRIGKLIH
jgi:signal peptidase I